MALVLNTPFDTPFGIQLPGTYWRWVGLSIDLVALQAVAVVRPFADEAAAYAGKSPVGPDRQYTLSGAEILTLLSPACTLELNQAIYGKAKEDPYFKDATDTEA